MTTPDSSTSCTGGPLTTREAVGSKYSAAHSSFLKARRARRNDSHSSFSLTELLSVTVCRPRQRAEKLSTCASKVCAITRSTAGFGFSSVQEKKTYPAITISNIALHHLFMVILYLP